MKVLNRTNESILKENIYICVSIQADKRKLPHYQAVMHMHLFTASEQGGRRSADELFSKECVLVVLIISTLTNKVAIERRIQQKTKAQASTGGGAPMLRSNCKLIWYEWKPRT